MKNTIKFLVLSTILMFSAVCFAPRLEAQVTNSPANSVEISDSKPVTISAGDLKVFRQTLADKVYFEARAKQFETSYGECRQNSESWQKLFVAEKSRADDILTEAANKQSSALKEKDLQFENFKTLLEDTRTENRELKFSVEKLKASRWKWGAIGFGTGLGVGGLAGNRLPRF